MKILVTDDANSWIEYHVKNLNEIFGDTVETDTAQSAKEGLDKITQNVDEPYNIIFTDMQMESDFLPMYAGEWFIRQIQTYPQYKNTRIIIISAAPDIKKIAEKYNVEYREKYKCRLKETYRNLF